MFYLQLSSFRALRQNYLHLGGNDPAILSQLADMISDAQALEDKKKGDNPKPSTKGKLGAPRWTLVVLTVVCEGTFGVV